MNPILLKPNSDTGSQVIVMGKPVGNMRVMEYVRYKPVAFTAAKLAYDSLAGESDAMVIEGAGSPGEVNLKSHDIVNMQMARHAGAPVLVVGDIDRGGVYASFVGTAEVLEPWERKLLAGWIVNRFRGDESLLADAHDYVQARTGKPVLGVVPYLRDLNIPQEDSVEFKSGAIDDSRDAAQCVEIAIIDLPHISNFTDFDALLAESDARVRIVRKLDDLRQSDAVVIPGSKNTLADLAYLKRTGLAARLREIAASGSAEIIGICGGFQMLGRSIVDPQCIESQAGRDDGLGLLAVDTVLAADKTLSRARAIHGPSGLEVVGYEIHHGLTAGDGGAARDNGKGFLTRHDGQSVGSASADGRIWGTYLHGIFDADEFRRWLLDRLRVRRGMGALGKVCSRYDIEPALDRLADVVRKSLDIERIYGLMGL
jgi:cobyric acid synthase CobQ